MFTTKSIKSKIANVKSKLRQLYKQIDLLCSTTKKQKRQTSTKTRQASKSKGRGRPPKQGVEKLAELEEKVNNQLQKL